MAGIGPPPKRSDQRVRRNKDGVEIERITMVGTVEVPELGLEDPHPLIEDFWYSLPESGQAQYYEPSDWQFARINLHFLDQQVKSSRPSGQLLASLFSSLTDLMVAEGQRRRLRIEIERNNGTETEAPQEATVSDMFKKRFAQ